MDYKIEKASKKDLGSILSLNQDSKPAVSSSSFEMMQHLFTICDYFKVCKTNGKIIGFLNALLPSKDYNSEHYNWFEDRYKSFIYVDRIVIHKSYQNKGYGTIFYNDLMKSFNKDSLNVACEINTRPYNKQSIQFHKKYGFKEVGKKDVNSNKSVMYMIYEW